MKKKSGKTTATNAKRPNQVRQKYQGTCFVLMPFKEPFDTYFTAIIEPAVRAAHLEPLRGDSLFRPSPIMGDVWQMIQDAKVLVAELTDKNANVFYELGLAHAIGKPVILISETIQDVPFDLQPLRVLLYNKSNPAWGAMLKAELVAFLEETVNDVGKAVPPMFRKIVKSQAPEESALELRLFELERRVASIEPTPSDVVPNKDRVRGRDIDWDIVAQQLRKPKHFNLDTDKPNFLSRAHAVAWTITQLRKRPSSAVRKTIISKLGPSEGDVVFRLAEEATHRPTIYSNLFPNQLRARKLRA